jgi:FAD/FMN-containing dehydrogenase
VVVFNAPAYAWEDSPELVTHTSWNDSADTWGDEGLQANSRALTAAAAAATPAAKLASCLAAIPGQPDVLLPSSPNFLLLANGLRTMRTRRPAAVVYPATVAQVQRALGCAAAAGVPPIPRSGGLRWVGRLRKARALCNNLVLLWVQQYTLMLWSALHAGGIK